MDHQSTISAFRSILLNYDHESDGSFGCDFAIKRFHKKLEIPNESKSKERKLSCFQTYIDFDERLAKPLKLSGPWYRARVFLHELLFKFELAPVVFTNGSEVESTRGFNSIEQKLMRSHWSCTVDCFDLWAEIAYNTRAIRCAARRRFDRRMLRIGKSPREVERDIWLKVKGLKNSKFLAFKFKLAHVTEQVMGSRFSTVRKNNEKDRPIDLQPLCNMLVQRCIGNGIRELLKGKLGIDLNHLAEKHRLLISNLLNATLDCTNASDSISCALCEFSFPRKFYNLLMASRTHMTYGLDKQYYMLNKISSMGNGFTFELMSLLLYAVGKQFDSEFSVFGDDIIINSSQAENFIKVLTEANFVINKDKSFIAGDFRESCGGNYHRLEGYIESFDFEYPDNILDCVAVHNKCYLLSKHYATFGRLYQLLHRVTPIALRGPVPFDTGLYGRASWDVDLNVDHFWTDKFKGIDIKLNSVESYIRDNWQYDEVKFFHRIAVRPKLASQRRLNIRPRHHTGKYFMYLHGGRVVDDILTTNFDVLTPLFVFTGQHYHSVKLVKSLTKNQAG